LADVRYQVLINGQVVCISGVDGLGGVLTATLSWVKRKRRPDDEVAESDDVLESHYFHVGGIDPSTAEHVKWCAEPLKPGDEVTIRILGPGIADEPKERYKFPG
jgi:hypothetical protein